MVGVVEIDGRGTDSVIVQGTRFDAKTGKDTRQDFVLAGVVGRGVACEWTRWRGLDAIAIGAEYQGYGRILSFIASALSDQGSKYNGKCRTFGLKLDALRAAIFTLPSSPLFRCLQLTNDLQHRPGCQELGHPRQGEPWNTNNINKLS